ncbi:MAG: lysophospholipid acyltransferase family protein [Luteolibacter sp.]
MSHRKPRKPQKPKKLRWRLECLGHTMIEGLAALLPGPWVFRLGEWLGALAWHLMPQRRRIVLRNLRIACAGEKDLTEIHRLARETFRRSGANLVSVSHTARLSPAQLREVLRVENMHLLEDAQARGMGVVLLLAHMGNWELLSRIIHLFPPGSKCGAFYRPLNNPLLDALVLARRQTDGTRMFSKRDPFHEVTKFLREGGIVGILADQRVGMQGEVVPFFGRLTRATPLPSLLARRAKAEVLSLTLVTEAPGKWKAVLHAVESPPTTAHCMAALEKGMKASPADVFWLQERWKVYAGSNVSFCKWLDGREAGGTKRHRALMWLMDADPEWHLPDDWKHPDISYQIAIPNDFGAPDWVEEDMKLVVPMFSPDPSVSEIRRYLRSWDGEHLPPLDFILAPAAGEVLRKSAKRESIPLIHIP